MKKFAFLILFVGTVGFAQNKDANAWMGYGLKIDITKDFQISSESQVRLDHNASRFSQYYKEIGGSYRIIKGLGLDLDYRYSRKNAGEYYYNQNRISLGVNYRYKLDMGLKFKIKSRYQYNFNRLSVVNDIAPEFKSVFRQGLSIDYTHPDFKLISPFIATEFFFAINPINTTSSIDSYRIKTGIDIDLPKRQSISIFYMFEHENRSLDNQTHVYGLQYNYEFRELYKKKKSKKSDKN